MAEISNRNWEIKRNRYLQQLIDSQRNGFIKVVTGKNDDGILTIGLFDFLLKEDSLDL